MSSQGKRARAECACAVAIILAATRQAAAQTLTRPAGEELLLVPGVPLDLGPARDGIGLRFAPGESRLIDAMGAPRAENASCSAAPQLLLTPAETADEVSVGRAVPRGGDGQPFAYRCDGNGLTPLLASGQLPSAALGMNSRGQVVGSYTLPGDDERAFLWEPAGLLDLAELCPGSGWRFVRAFDVDDAGTVVGLGELAGQPRLFLLHTGSASRTLQPGGLWLLPGGTGPAPYPGPPLAEPAPCLAAGAELGTLGPWTCTRSIYGAAPAPIVCAAGPNTVVAAGTPDLAGTGLQAVGPQGGANAIRIGDALSGSDVGSPVGFVDAIERTFTVSVVNPVVHYLYAMVLEDGGHLPAAQPYFRVRIYVPPTATTPVYDDRRVASATDPFFTDLGGGLLMRAWSCGRADLTSFAGATALMRVEVADCGFSGHFGYAYFDVPCDPYRVDIDVPPCLETPPQVDGSSNLPAVAHFWSVQESDLQWNRYGIEATEWFNGPAGLLDIESFYESHGGTYVCGKRYRVGLALSTECEPWISKGILVYANCADAGPDLYRCPHGPPTILAVPQPQPPVQYTWTTGGRLVGTGPSVSVQPTFTTEFVLTAWDPVTGCTATDRVVVHALEDFTVQVSACRCGGDVRLTATADRPLEAGTTYTWTPGGLTGQTVTVHPDSDLPTTYTVTVDDGCYSNEGSIAVAGAPPLALIAPNSFTPYGSIGLNDVFEIFHLGIDTGYAPAYDAQSMTLRVWDRWGGLVYVRTWTAPACGAFSNGELEWDGIANKNVKYSGLFWRPDVRAGSLVPLGVYTYKVYLTRCNGSSELTPVNGEYAPHVTVAP